MRVAGRTLGLNVVATPQQKLRLITSFCGPVPAEGLKDRHVFVLACHALCCAKLALMRDAKYQINAVVMIYSYHN